MYEQGSLILVPFPFTDLTSFKKRPAIVISPNWFNCIQEDIVLVAVTSLISRPMDERIEILLSKENIASGKIPRESVVKISKIFTCHKEIITKKVAIIEGKKLNEILEKLRSFIQPTK